MCARWYTLSCARWCVRAGLNDLRRMRAAPVKSRELTDGAHCRNGAHLARTLGPWAAAAAAAAAAVVVVVGVVGVVMALRRRRRQRPRRRHRSCGRRMAVRVLHGAAASLPEGTQVEVGYDSTQEGYHSTVLRAEE